MTGSRATANRATWTLVPGPGATAAYLAAVVAGLSLLASIAFGLAGFLLFLLVMGGVAATWWSRLPGTAQAAIVLAMVGSAWAAILGWYEAIWWLDLAAHLVLNGLLALLTVAVLEGIGWLRLVPIGTRSEQAGAMTVITSLGLALAVVWEFGEWVGNRFVDGGVNVGYADTLSDMAMGGLGSLVVGVLWARWAARRAVRS